MRCVHRNGERRSPSFWIVRAAVKLAAMFFHVATFAADVTMLHQAAKNGDVAEIKLLLKKGANVNAKDNRDETPLHFVADEGHKDVAELIIAKGADVNAKNVYNMTPLHVATFPGIGKKAIAEKGSIK